MCIMVLYNIENNKKSGGGEGGWAIFEPHESHYTKLEKWKHQFFRRLRAATSVVHGRIWPNFKLILAFMYVIITCKYEKDPIKNNREKVATLFFKL